MRFPGSFRLRSIVMVIGIPWLGQVAHAADFGGLYFGGNAGAARIDYDNARYQEELVSQASTFGALDFTGASLRKLNAAWWVDSGYLFTPYVGIEADYLHFGALYDHVTGKYTPTGGTVEPVIAATLVRSDGPAMGLVFRLPLTDSFDLRLRLADYYGRTTLVNTVDASKASSSRETANSSSLLVGVGAAYTFDGHWSAHVDYLRVNQAGNSSNVVKYDVDAATVGVSYTF
jgi:hypothetical protein